MNTTMRDNILFGEPVEDEDRYQNVIDLCCLREDIGKFAEGDLTQVIARLWCLG